MALITIPKPPSGNPDIEYASLETHVVMSLERYRALEARLAKAEKELENVHAQLRTNKLYIIGATSTVLAGICSTLITLMIAVQKF